MAARENLDYYLEKNLQMYSDYIVNNINFSHIKYGDGEIECMKGSIGENADHCKYTKELGDALKKSLIELSKIDSVYFADWYYSNPPINAHDFPNKTYYDSLIKDLNIKFIQSFELIMMGYGNMERPYLFNFYRTIKEINRKKMYICPTKLNEIKDIFKIDEIVNIPLFNAFNEYEKTLNEVLPKLEDNMIIILSVGMQSPVLALDMLNHNPNITILDMGSGWDPLSGTKSRDHYQTSTEQAKEYLQNL